MIVVDANVLLYAHDPDSPHHARCREWLESAFNGSEQIGLAWQTILAFVRLITNRRVFRRPFTAREACGNVSAWLENPQVVVIEPGERFWAVFSQLVVDAQVSGPLITDAALASLALERGASVCTTDRDFARFRGLRVIDLLQ